MIKNTIRFLQDCLLVDNKLLVIGDLHLGSEEVIPGLQVKEIIEKLEGVFSLLKKEKVKVKKVVLLGDIKHDFASISDGEWRDSLKLFDYLAGKVGKNIVVLRGNHDNKLNPILRKRGIELKDKYIYENICFLHGNAMFEQLFKQCLDSDVFVIGHLHPAITLSDKYKREKYKCFLRGNLKGKLVYILPSFNEGRVGFDLKKSDNKELKNFEVIVYNTKNNKELNFGKLKKLV